MARHILPALLPLLATSVEAGSGKMTMWSLHSDVIVGSNIPHEGGPSSCKFADPATGGLKSPSAGSPYIKSRMYCAADINTLYDKGMACGKCYHISYGGTGGTDGGHAGSATIQVINSGTMNHGATFDCQGDAFSAITGGARTGVYPISWEEVTCDQSEGLGVAMVESGGNAWYTKVVFSNLAKPAKSVVLIDDGKRNALSIEPCCGSWKGQLKGGKGPVGFELTHADGSKTTFDKCFDAWPVKAGKFCAQGGSATTGSSGPAPGPAPASGPAPAPATSPASSKKCAKRWSENCLESKCCEDKAYTCFQKSVHWASCRQHCTKGEVDKGSKNPWQCNVLSEATEGKKETAATGCSARWSENCAKSRCCKEDGFKCYKKSPFWASCKRSCKKGEVDKHSKYAWDCTDLTKLNEDIPPVVVEASSSTVKFGLGGAAFAALIGLAATVARRRRQMVPGPELLSTEE